jgi:ferredoxin
MNTVPPLPVVDMSRCTRCGLCVEACRCHAIEMTEQGPVFHCEELCVPGGECPVSDGACPHNGECWCACQEACPEHAIDCPFEIVFYDEGASESDGRD